MKQMFILVALVLMFCTVFGITWEDTAQLIGIPAVSFAGEPAMQAVGDTIYIAYLSRIDDNYSSLHFTKSSAEDTYTTSVIGSTDYFISSDPGAPSLVLDLPNITILVKGEDCLYRCLSENYGVNWTCQSLDGGLIDSNDPYPLMSITDEGVRNFTVKSQATDVCMHFLNVNQSMNETNVYYYGPDVVDGPVLINSDLYIKQAGGGSNGGWPTFLGPVTIAGQVISTPATYPTAQVFQGGLIQNADSELFRTNNELFKQDYRANAQVIGQEGGNNIILMDVNGMNATIWHGAISEPYTVNTDVYDPYPSVGGTPLFSNSFTVVDTVWTPMGGMPVSGQSFFVRGTLWIKGTFTGQVSIYCDSDIYLIGDILLSGTLPPASPYPANLTDKVSLISEKQIIIKYGYKNPADSLRIHPNMGADNEYPDPLGGGIFVYADLIALNKDASNPRYDGMFTFEYQHPHPSIPALNMEIGSDTHFFDWIDLHRRHYPQTIAHPWPPAIDYPWYNPLWPEKAPYLERGTVNHWGALYQERRGYMHRSLNDNEYPSGSGVWDIDLDMCGGPVTTTALNDPVLGNIGLQARNYPGASGSGVGYKKVHSNDPRSFERMARNDVWGLGALISESNGFSGPPSVVTWHKLNEPVIHKSMDHIGEEYLYHLNNTLFTDEAAYPQDLVAGFKIVQAKLLANGNVLTLQQDIGDAQQPCRLMITNLETGNDTYLYGSPYTQDYISLHRILDGFIFVTAGDTENTARLIRLDENGNILSIDDTLPLTADFGSDSLLDSRIVLSNPEPGIIHACLWAKNSASGSSLWHLQGSIGTISVDDPAIVPAALSIRCFPNPFTDQISLKVKSPVSQAVKINIYNIKGQKVKSLQLTTQSGSGQITWNGNDDKGHPVAQGIYFARIADAEHTKITKILKIK
ncbi:MAG: T9SS type A sorting domain-containing protein [Candidatus Cloacimonetes bacterium]|nr:T9SS type A sorting domain-containing protein [Candidatus Cloacimonadota bacterium]